MKQQKCGRSKIRAVSHGFPMNLFQRVAFYRRSHFHYYAKGDGRCLEGISPRVWANTVLFYYGVK